MKRKGLYIILLVLTMALLLLPALQKRSNWFKQKPLNGVTVAVEQPGLNWHTFINGSFQQQEEQYLSEHLGFRESLIRLYNQVTWSLFRSCPNSDIWVGHDNWIFNKYMIRHRDGQTLYEFGENNEKVMDMMNHNALMLIQLQELLEEYGVTLFVCLAPGKDVICGEHMPPPQSYDRPSGVKAFEFLPPIFDSLGVNYLNFNSYYLQIKDTVSYPLYLKSSFHWSNLAACYAADTLIHYMEAVSGKNLHNLIFSEPYQAVTRDPDGDLEQLMNLFWSLEGNEGTYVDVSTDDDSTAMKPRWLIVGDSYFWQWQYNLPWDGLVESNHYWYYNNTVFNDPDHDNVSQVDMLNELLTSDFVMLLYSPMNVYELNRRFLTQALICFYFEEGKVQEQLEKIKQDIRNVPEWYANIEQQAQANGQEVEAALNDNASYMLYSLPWLYFDEFNAAHAAPCRNPRVFDYCKPNPHLF